MKYVRFYLGMVLLLNLLFYLTNAFSQEVKDNSVYQFNQKSPRPKPPERFDSDRLKRELGDDWEKIVLDRIESESPDELAEFKEEKLNNPAKYFEKLTRAWEELKKLEILKDSDPEKYTMVKKQHQLEHQSRKLAQEYRKTKNASKKSEVKAALGKNLQELFELREADREQKVKKLEQEIKMLRDMLVVRQQKKQEIISRRLNELLGEDDVLKW